MLCRSERRSMALDNRTELSISARGLEATIEQLLLKVVGRFHGTSQVSRGGMHAW